MATQTLTTTSSIGTAQPKWTRLQRLWNSMIEAQQARADRCVADYLQNIGWKLTDSAEREIERRSSSISDDTRGLELGGERKVAEALFDRRVG